LSRLKRWPWQIRSANRERRKISRDRYRHRHTRTSEIPRSGQPDELIDRYGISARHIVEAVKHAVARRPTLAYGGVSETPPVAGRFRA